MKIRKVASAVCAVVLSVSMTVPAYAGLLDPNDIDYDQRGFDWNDSRNERVYCVGWQERHFDNDGCHSMYMTEEGKYLTGWNWIKGKCYYFDEKGYLLAGTTTPDGCTVDASGAWVVDGEIQYETAELAAEAAKNKADHPLAGYIDFDKYFISAPLGRGWTSKWETTKSVMEDLEPELYQEMRALGQTMRWEERCGDKTGKLDDSKDVMYGTRCGAGVGVEILAGREQNPFYLQSTCIDGNVIALLSGRELPETYIRHRQEFYPSELTTVQETADAVREFLNSFDWKHASDMEKAKRICDWIQQADYDRNDEVYYDHLPYSCLVEKKTKCAGYTETAKLLGFCVGLPVLQLGTVNHAWPVFLVDGVWLENEPTRKDRYLTIADVYELNMGGYYQQIGSYCEQAGYEIPEDLSRFASYSGIEQQWMFGKYEWIVDLTHVLDFRYRGPGEA